MENENARVGDERKLDSTLKKKPGHLRKQERTELEDLCAIPQG